MQDPQNGQEWQIAVDLADSLLHIDAARQYGLLHGAPDVDAERCLEIRKRAAELGIRPSKDALQKTLEAFS